MLRLTIAGPAALLALTVFSTLAQPSRAAAAPAAGSFEVTCPPTLKLTYGGIARLPWEDKDLEIRGFQPRFVPSVVRLIDPDVAPHADANNEIQNGMPDNHETAKPGEPLLYTVWSANEREPAFAAAVTCRYEGGYSLQRPLPRTTRACTLTYSKRKAAANETSTREFYTRAVFACR